MKKEMNFKTITELAWFTAETIISKEFTKNKKFPLEWDYSLTDEQINFIPQKKIKNQILKDIVLFCKTCLTITCRQITKFLAIHVFHL